MSVVGVHTFHKDELCRAVGARIDFSGGRRLRGLMNENKERWINIEEVAEYIGVSPVTVRYWLRLSLIHISEPTRRPILSRMPSSA